VSQLKADLAAAVVEADHLELLRVAVQLLILEQLELQQLNIIQIQVMAEQAEQIQAAAGAAEDHITEMVGTDLAEAVALES
jgi:hypothetical protein